MKTLEHIPLREAEQQMKELQSMSDERKNELAEQLVEEYKEYIESLYAHWYNIWLILGSDDDMNKYPFHLRLAIAISHEGIPYCFGTSLSKDPKKSISEFVTKKYVERYGDALDVLVRI
jgi:predicted house-cleaning noncanonical NTP pyrophosphatase (MazG superfamily)